MHRSRADVKWPINSGRCSKNVRLLATLAGTNITSQRCLARRSLCRQCSMKILDNDGSGPDYINLHRINSMESSELHKERRLLFDDALTQILGVSGGISSLRTIWCKKKVSSFGFRSRLARECRRLPFVERRAPCQRCATVRKLMK